MFSDSDVVFEVRDVSYAYEDVSALKEVCLKIRRGERLALLGANGSGKSTLLRLLAGLSFPDEGNIYFCGENLTASQLESAESSYAFRRRVGVVFQNPDVQLFNPSVFDEVAFGPLQLRWPKEQIRERVLAVLADMEIAHLSERAPHRLSGGEKKRVALASVLVLDPEVLLLDEPTAGLDPSSAAQIVSLLSSWRNGAKTVITATHELDVLEDIADRCCVLESGHLVGDEKPLVLLHDVSLLERTALIRLHAHTHKSGLTSPHPHLHQHERR
jgi:cobalt/nickel transport system ATP-binding protein